MPIQRKKKATKRRNPCLPCNPSTRATRFSRIKRNPKFAHRSEKEIVDIIENAWNIKPGKMNWLEMEDTIRLIFALYDNDLISETRALGLIGETVAAFTRRGEVTEKQIY